MSSTVGSLRVAARIARRDLRRAPGRTALVTALIALPVLAAVLAVVLVRSATMTDATYVEATLGDELEARLTYTCPGTVRHLPRVGEHGMSCGSDDDEPSGARTVGELEDRILALLPGARLTRVETTTASIGTGSRAERGHHVEEVDLEAPGIAGAHALEAGRFPERVGEVLVAYHLADTQGITPGDTLDVSSGEGSRPVTVVGVLDRHRAGFGSVVAPVGTLGGDPASADRDLLPTEDLSWFVSGVAVPWADVLALNELGLGVTSRAAIEHPPSRAETAAVMRHLGPRSDLQMLGLGAAVVAVGLLEAVLLIGPAFAVGARRSTRELALVAAAGAERRDLSRIVLGGGLVLGAGASVLGAVLGLVLGVVLVTLVPATAASFPNLRLPLLEVCAVVVIGTVIALAAAWLPARQAARVDVVAALAGRRSEARPRRAVPIVGLVLLGVGTLTALAGGARGEAVLVVMGVLLLMLGMVAASGGIVTVLGRCAPRARLVLRLALRDAARQRGRTAPAVAAVIAAVAGATAGAVYFTADQERDRLTWTPAAAEGVVQIGLPSNEQDATVRERLLDEALGAALAVVPDARHAPVRMLVAQADPAGYGGLWVHAETPEENLCPLWLLERQATAQEQAAHREDPRCAPDVGGSGRSVWSTSQWSASTLVDDGSVVELLGLPAAAEAAAALRSGHALVDSESVLWPDGTAHLVVGESLGDAEGTYVEEELVLPARSTGWRHWTYETVLPAGSVSGLTQVAVEPEDVGLVLVPDVPLTADEVAALERALQAVDPEIGLLVEEPFTPRTPVETLAVVLLAAVVGLGATWITVGLTAAESRADLATLAAVGAAPRTRRWLTGAQAGVVAGTGTVLGVATGLLLGVVFVQVQAGLGTPWPDPTWQVVVPWPTLAAVLVGLPALAVLAAGLAVRSRLPLVRRAGT